MQTFNTEEASDLSSAIMDKESTSTTVEDVVGVCVAIVVAVCIGVWSI